jgi:LacI family transcriptional regulator
MENDREITIYDVAKALNISPSTVSRGLKDHPHIKKETARKIKLTASQMGYQQNKFASNLRQKRTNTIGVVVPRLNSYFMATVISGIENITNKYGYGLIISQSRENQNQEAASVSTMFNSRVDGLLVSLSLDTNKLDHFNIFLNKNIPVVFFDRVTECFGCMSVVVDNYKAGYEAVNHLVEQGCRRIMHMGGNMLRNVYNDRFRGYRQVLADNNIPFDEDLVVISGMKGEDGVNTARKILGMKNRPDGIFVSNDTCAVAIIVELEKAGLRIPEDIAVVGFNNEPISQIVRPNLTSVDYPALEIGEIAATSLINKLTNASSDNLNNVVLKHKLIVRESSMKIKF